MLKKAVVGACGICCSTCRFSKTLNCGCSSGDEAKAIEKVATNWGGRGVLCLVLKCAVEKKIAYCAQDCDQFPCDKYKKWHFPYGEAYLNMCQTRRLQEK